MPNRLSISPYWLCQFLGWGAVIPYWYYYESRGGIAFYWVICSVFAQVGIQIFVTDQYRRLVHRKRWLELPLGKLLPIVFVAWLLLTAQYMVMTYTVFHLRFDHSYLAGDTALGAIAGGTRYHAIWLLAFHLYHYARQSAGQRAVAAEAQLAKLSNDLNPHFLFNALNGIKGLTREDPAQARSAIDRLAELLRYSLRRSAQPLVPLSEEMQIIEEYVALEKMRLEERLVFTHNRYADFSDCQLPPLSLHTLVENAVKHGIARMPEGGSICLNIDQTGKTWAFTVTNPCPATSPGGHRSASEWSTSRPESPEWEHASYLAENTTGTGLNNLRERLRLQYGGRAGLTTDRAATTFTATLHLPK